MKNNYSNGSSQFTANLPLLKPLWLENTCRTCFYIVKYRRVLLMSSRIELYTNTNKNIRTNGASRIFYFILTHTQPSHSTTLFATFGMRYMNFQSLLSLKKINKTRSRSDANPHQHVDYGRTATLDAKNLKIWKKLEILQSEPFFTTAFLRYVSMATATQSRMKCIIDLGHRWNLSLNRRTMGLDWISDTNEEWFRTFGKGGGREIEDGEDIYIGRNLFRTRPWKRNIEAMSDAIQWRKRFMEHSDWCSIGDDSGYTPKHWHASGKLGSIFSMLRLVLAFTESLHRYS